MITKWLSKLMSPSPSVLLLATLTCSQRQQDFQLKSHFTCRAKLHSWSNTNYKTVEVSSSTILHPKSLNRNDIKSLYYYLKFCYNFSNIPSISSLIEKNIGTWANNTCFWYASARAIIKIIPFAFVFTISCVMTSSKTSIMIANRIQIINRLVTVWNTVCSFIFRWDYCLFYLGLFNIRTYWQRIYQIISHVQNNWKVHLCFIFLLSDHTFLFESFQMQNEYFWSSINGHLFASLFMLFACRTIPFIPRLKFLRLPHLFEAVCQIYRLIITLLLLKFMLLCYIVKVFKFVKGEILVGAFLESNVKLTVFFI